MPLGTAPVVPAALTIQAQYSASQAAYIDQQFSIVPKNPDGSNYDLTAQTSLTLYIAVPYLQGTYPYGNVAVTVSSHNASGTTFKLTGANMSSLLSTVGSAFAGGIAVPALPFTIRSSDGTTDVITCIGTMVFKAIA